MENKTRYGRLKNKMFAVQTSLWELEREKESKEQELEKYCRRHPSMKFDDLFTKDVEKLQKIYQYFDEKYEIEWQGGLRCDERGMALGFWLHDDPDFMIIHISSTCENICFSGSTSWFVPARTFKEKIDTLKKIKKDICKILTKEADND